MTRSNLLGLLVPKKYSDVGQEIKVPIYWRGLSRQKMPKSSCVLLAIMILFDFFYPYVKPNYKKKHAKIAEIELKLKRQLYKTERT